MTKTKYTMVVYLKAGESSDTKERLKKNKFMIVLHDEITNQYYDDDEESVSKIMDSNHSLKFVCLYSDNVPLSQEIIRHIDNDPLVIQYSIGKLIE